MIPNTIELPIGERQKYISRLLTTYTLRYNENGILTPTNLFLKAVNSFIDTGLERFIKAKAPPGLVKDIITAGCLLLSHHGIDRTDFFHIFNITLQSMGRIQIANISHVDFWGWVEYFFPDKIINFK